MQKTILKILAKNAKTSVEDIAIMTGLTVDEVAAQIDEMEKKGVIRGYKAVIDWESLDDSKVSALIELKVTPEAEAGFEDIAKMVMKYDEVESVYLMSGTFDLCCIVKAKTFKEVAMFVAKQLAPMPEVISTSTHFVLRRYKELDVELYSDAEDDRGRISLC